MNVVNDGAPDIHLLFRFRDLVGETIPEHRRIIDAQGYCWWGWWKRPSEDAREDIWHTLPQASEQNPVAVGLFNSGTGEVYLANVTRVIPPNDIAPSLQAIPPGEEQAVPEYYRASPFSRAWMRMTSIENPFDFFGRYSYSGQPRLNGYSEAALRRFENKVILSAQELRQMDTTIWRIRRRRNDDTSAEVYLTYSGVNRAISSDAITCRSNLVLHISDSHFSIGRNRNQHVWRLEDEGIADRWTMVEAINDAIVRANKKIGMVIVTGDLTFTGEAAEFVEASKALNRLLGLIDLAPSHLVIVPGNHDIRWATDDEYRPGSPVTEAPQAATANYKAFYRDLFNHDPSRHLAMGRRYALPSGISIEVCALNSSSLLQGRNWLAGMGRIDEASFGSVAADLGWDAHKKSMALRVLAVHHHVALMNDLESPDGFAQGFGIASDAVRIQRLAAERGVQLVLHGHKHRAFVWRNSVYHLPDQVQTRYNLGSISIAGGGSAGSSDVEAGQNYFNILDVTSGGVNLTMYRSQNRGMFDPMSQWDAAFRLDERLTLEDWGTK